MLRAVGDTFDLAGQEHYAAATWDARSGLQHTQAPGRSMLLARLAAASRDILRRKRTATSANQNLWFSDSGKAIVLPVACTVGGCVIMHLGAPVQRVDYYSMIQDIFVCIARTHAAGWLHADLRSVNMLHFAELDLFFLTDYDLAVPTVVGEVSLTVGSSSLILPPKEFVITVCLKVANQATLWLSLGRKR